MLYSLPMDYRHRVAGLCRLQPEVEGVRLGPQPFARQEAVFHSGARQLLQVLVAQVVVERGTNVFAGDVDAANAFIVRGQRDGDVSVPIEREAGAPRPSHRECLRSS